MSIGPEVIFTGENEVTCESALVKLKDFLKSSTDRDGGKKISLKHVLAIGIIATQRCYNTLAIHPSKPN